MNRQSDAVSVGIFSRRTNGAHRRLLGLTHGLTLSCYHQEEETRERRLSFREMSLSEGFDATATNMPTTKKKFVTTSVGGGFVTSSKKEVAAKTPPKVRERARSISPS